MAEEVKPLTKRKGLRFRIESRMLRYRNGDNEGEALIADISAGGCFAHHATLPLSPDENVTIFLDFIDPENGLEIEASVVRSEGNEFAVEFLNVSEELNRQMVKFFASDIRKNHP